MRKRGWMALLLAALMICLAAFPASAAEQAESATAASIQLMKTEGAVNVTNSNGRSLSKRDNMRLYNGYHVKTEAKSYAWINLDSEKLTKLDAVSEAEVRKSGKQQELLLDSGSIFFNVTSPLKDEETLNIRTATMVVGIRGTSGWLRVVDQWSAEICVLEGTVQCNVSDPVTGQIRTATVQSGEKAVATAYSQDREGDKCEIVQERLDPADIHGFVLEELAGDPGLCAEIYEASGLDVQSALARAQERLEQDQQEMQDKLDSIEGRLIEQEDNNTSAGHVWTPGGSAGNTPGSSSGDDSGGGSGSGDNSGSGDSSGSGGDSSGGGSSGGGSGDSSSGGGSGGGDSSGGSGGSNSSGENDPTTRRIAMPQNAETVHGYFEEDGVEKIVLLADSSASNNTLNVNSIMEIPAGKTLILAEGVDAEVGEYAALFLNGTMTGEGNNTFGIANRGMLYVSGDGTLEMRSIQNNGAFINEGGRIVTDSLTTNGVFGSAGAIEGTVIHAGGDTEITGGTIKNPASGAALVAQGNGTIGIFGGAIDGGSLPALLVTNASVRITVGDLSVGPNRAVLRSGLRNAVVRFDANGAELEYVAAGGTVGKGGVLTVVPDGDGAYRLAGAADDIAAALNGAKDGGIVVLPWDLETNGMSVTASPAGLDLNGHTLTVNGVITVSGALELYDSGEAGAIRSRNANIIVDGAGERVTPEGFIVTDPDGEGWYSLVRS